MFIIVSQQRRLFVTLQLQVKAARLTLVRRSDVGDGLLSQQYPCFFQMITGQLSLVLCMSMLNRSERYIFRAGCRGFKSRLPLQLALKRA